MKIEIENVTLGYPQRHAGPRLLAEHLSFAAPEGELVALLGRNGVGKSTLLRVLAGVRRPLKGRATLDGTEIAAMAARERARKIAFVTTEQIAAAHLRVDEVVAMGRAPYTGWFGTLAPEDRRVVGEALERVGMSAFRDKTVESLSDGERQRVMIARALAQDTPLMLLDEPTAFLDLPNRYQIALLLRELAHDTGKTVIFSSHDLSTAIELCDTLWVMTPGGVAAGAPEDLMRSGALNAMFEQTPLSLSSEGTVKLNREALHAVRIESDADNETGRLLVKTVERCGFAIVSETAGTNVAAEITILPGNGGFRVSGTDNKTTAFAADFHEIAALLRQLAPLR
ncbi:ABC transporter ATP-binding protein [uncultured Rikenella sp.]|uniref:ABC transporter ATP-binding protein n=1 Tax=uncultured Rikenella sp. TaxID=368003 RepID=UPI002610BC22|nr:ABC transporter ATP-binding protein [uncultured Rikenella sp.]